MTEPSGTSQGTGAMKFFGIPATGLAALPACPACYPAYMAVLSALGLGGLSGVGAQTILTFVFLAVALGALAFRARRRRGFGPFLVGVVAVAVVLAGKLWLWLDVLTYAGVGLLLAASVWNVWPRRTVSSECTACSTEDETSGSGRETTAPAV